MGYHIRRRRIPCDRTGETQHEEESKENTRGKRDGRIRKGRLHEPGIQMRVCQFDWQTERGEIHIDEPADRTKNRDHVKETADYKKQNPDGLHFTGRTDSFSGYTGNSQIKKQIGRLYGSCSRTDHFGGGCDSMAGRAYGLYRGR